MVEPTAKPSALARSSLERILKNVVNWFNYKFI